MDTLFCYHIVVMLVSTVAFVLLWVGFSTPAWLTVSFQEGLAKSEFTVSSLNRSLWYDLHCPQELKDCKTCSAGDASKDCVKDMGFPLYSAHFNWIEELTKEKEEWLAWGIIMIFVVVLATFGFVLVLTLVCCIFKTSEYRAVAWAGFFMWLLAGLLVWVPVGMVADMHLDIDDAVNAKRVSSIDGINHDASLNTPYSLIIAAVGGFMALIAAIMLIWLTGICSRDDDRSSSRSDTELFSERPKSTVVHDQRFYGPYPYYPSEPQMHYREADPYYIQRTGEVSEVVVNEYPHYQKHLAPSQWGPNPW